MTLASAAKDDLVVRGWSRRLPCLVVVLAITACSSPNEAPGSAAVSTSVASSTSTAPQEFKPPVDVCSVIDRQALQAKGISADHLQQKSDGGVVPSDSCPIFQQGQSITVGQMQVAMVPFSTAQFQQARAMLRGTPAAGVADEAFSTRRGRPGLYARRGDLVVAVTYPNALSHQDQIALIKTAFNRLASGFAHKPHAWPPYCDRIDHQPAAALLGVPIRASRGSVTDKNIACNLFAGPGHVNIWFRQSSLNSRQGKDLQRIPGMSAEAYVDRTTADAYVVVEGREAFLDIWLPDADLKAVKGGRPRPVQITPELVAFCQHVADAMAT